MVTKISQVKHPEYNEEYEDFCKWRLAYRGGRQFIDAYLKPLSKREMNEDFLLRKNIAYVPNFSAAAINKIKNAIYQRMSDVTRVGGPKSYNAAVIGSLGGVDLDGSTMNTFMGTKVLTELMVMRKVGILVDAPQYEGQTLLDKGTKHPFVTIYHRECIKSWSYVYENNVKQLNAVLLEEHIDKPNDFGLPSERETRYRYMKRVDNGIEVSFFTKTDQPDDVIILDLPRIPLEIIEIPVSLMQDVADIQVALLNLESSDISFALKANYPFFYEFFDQKTDPQGFKPSAVPNSDGTATSIQPAKERELKVGGTQGRAYPKGLEAPGFINPSAETLQVSMKKGDQLIEHIYRLVNLNLENTARSAESKEKDQQTIESSLSFFGLMLQKAEISIGELWTLFEGENESPKITYPENYSLKSEEERREEANDLIDGIHDVPSNTYRRQIARKVARLRIGHEVPNEVWKKIENEIETAETLTADPEQLIADVEAGLLTRKTASKARGYKESEVEEAQKERAEHIRLTLEAQGGPENASAARGASDFGGTTGKDEKVGKPKRGEGQ